MMRLRIPHTAVRRKVPVLGAFLLLVCLAVPVSARVFRLLGPDKVPELNNGTYPWETAYKTTMTVNGRPAEMRLYSARYSEPVLDQLRARFEALGAKVAIVKSPDGATGLAKWPDNREARILVLSPASEPRHLMFVFYPEPGSSPQETKFPVPKYVGGTALYTVSNDETGTFFSTLSTMADATEVHTFYATQMPANGWKMISPALVSNGAVSGMAVYQKGKQVCYVQAVNRAGQANMVTLLVKGGKL